MQKMTCHFQPEGKYMFSDQIDGISLAYFVI